MARVQVSCKDTDIKLAINFNAHKNKNHCHITSVGHSDLIFADLLSIWDTCAYIEIQKNLLCGTTPAEVRMVAYDSVVSQRRMHMY